MSVSPEVKAAVDEIRREHDALRAAAKANDLQASQIADLKTQIQALKPGSTLSDEDKQALLDAINGVGETNTELATAVPANVDASAPAGAPVAPLTPLPDDPLAARPDPIAGTGQSGTVPLMPNSAFDPSGGIDHGPGTAAQPNQAQAIETSGGFVLSGGGQVARSPSDPATPSDPPMAFGPDVNKGPTVEEYVAAGYLASNYPPVPYVSRSSPERIAAAIAAQNAIAPSPPAAVPASPVS
jgi:hypothetical protein